MSAEERHKKCCTRLGAHFTVSEETKRKISASNKGKHLTAEQRIKAGLANKGRIHITNGIEDKMIYPEEEAAYIEKGFYRGRSKNRKDYKNSQKEVMTY